MRTIALVLVDIVVILSVARALGALLVRARLPPVMGEVLAGVVLGASVLGTLPGDPSSALFPPGVRDVLAVLGEIAVVAYLFGVGAQLHLGSLRTDGRAVAAVALASFAVPWLAGAILALSLRDEVAGDPPLVPFMLFLGTALAVTAFPVLSRVVDALGLRRRRAGRVALTAAAAQELLVWPALAVALALGSGVDRSPSAVIVGGAASIAGVVVLARAIVPAIAARRQPGEGAIVLVGLALSAAATEIAGLHLVLGAVLFAAALPSHARAAGAAVLRTRPARLASVVLLPLFFAVPTLRVDVGALGGDGLGLLAVVLAVAVVSKVASAATAAGLAGLGRRDALTVGALMNTRGLVELVVLAIGLEAGLIDERLFSVMVLVALVTTFATGPLVARIGRTGGRGRERAFA